MLGRRCRVLYTQAWSGGGSELSLYELVRGLDRDRYEPVVIFRWPGCYQKLFSAIGVRVIVLSEIVPKKLLPPEVPPDSRCSKRSSSRVLHLISSLYSFLVREPWLALYVARIFRRESADLVHHNCGLNADRAMVLAGYLAKLPQISHFRLFSNLTFVARRMIRFVDAFIYNSKAVCEFYTRLGIPSEKGYVIYNPIDSEAFSPDTDCEMLRDELGLAQKDCLVSNVGRIVPWKGQDLFLRAMAEVIKTHPNTKILVVGEPGPANQEQRYDRNLRILVEDLGLSGHVIFTGLRSDIPRLMAVSSVVVHSAVRPEPFGRVIAEALMAGRPVVATAGGGVPEIIDDGITGLLVPPGDVNAMTEAVRSLLSDHVKANAMAHRARSEAIERFTVQRHARAVEHVYAKIVNRCSNPS